jgi:hypothetical protein
MNYKLWGGVTCAGSLGIMIIVLCWFVGDRSAVPMNLTVTAMGFAVGWLLGILLSPYSKNEQARFTTYASAFGVFASGYLVGKVDKVLEAIFDPQFILDSVHGFRSLAFATSLILGLIVTFMFRQYAR